MMEMEKGQLLRLMFMVCISESDLNVVISAILQAELTLLKQLQDLPEIIRLDYNGRSVRYI